MKLFKVQDYFIVVRHDEQLHIGFLVLKRQMCLISYIWFNATFSLLSGGTLIL